MQVFKCMKKVLKCVFTNALSVLRLPAFSILSLMTAEAALYWARQFLLEDPSTYLDVYNGWYHILELLLCTLIFYLLLTLSHGKVFKSRYLERTKENRDQGQRFSFAGTFCESVKEACRGEIWKYGVFCIWPTISCVYAFVKGGVPQEVGLTEPNLFGLAGLGSFVELGYVLFRSQHYYFEVFYPIGVACVPLGLITGSTIFVTLSSLGSTLIKRNAYRRATGKTDISVIVLWGLLLAVALVAIFNIILFMMIL